MCFEWLRALLCDEHNGWPAFARFCDAPDSGDGDTGDGARQAGAGWRGKEQFVILAAMKSLSQSCSQTERQQSRIDFGDYAGLLAEMSQVGGEAVAQVESGCGQAAALKPEALGDAWLGIKVRGKQRFQTLWNAWRFGATGIGQFGQ
jgi:hypothetical protein